MSRPVRLQRATSPEAAQRLLGELTPEDRVQALTRLCLVFHGYSRRYCDGRRTYAPWEHNQATHELLALGVTPPHDPISTTGPFAADGQLGLEAREHEALKEARHLSGLLAELRAAAEQDFDPALDDLSALAVRRFARLLLRTYEGK